MGGGIWKRLEIWKRMEKPWSQPVFGPHSHTPDPKGSVDFWFVNACYQNNFYQLWSHALLRRVQPQMPQLSCVQNAGGWQCHRRIRELGAAARNSMRMRCATPSATTAAVLAAKTLSKMPNIAVDHAFVWPMCKLRGAKAPSTERRRGELVRCEAMSRRVIGWRSRPTSQQHCF